MIQVYPYYKHLSITAIFSFGVFSGLGELSELENLSRYPIILQILADIKFSSIRNRAHCLHVIVLAGPSQKKLCYQRVPNSKQSKLVFKWLCDAVANTGFMCGWTDLSDCVDYQISVTDGLSDFLNVTMHWLICVVKGLANVCWYISIHWPIWFLLSYLFLFKNIANIGIYLFSIINSITKRLNESMVSPLSW